MYTPQDVSIIIVTYNRPGELENNLGHLAKLKDRPGEVLVVDQSKDKLTKKACLKYKKKIKSLRYLRSEIPSIAIAKNKGVRSVSKKSKILLFLDDDAYVGPNYLKEIINGYKRHPQTKGIFGYPPEEKIPKIRNFVKKVFMLGSEGKAFTFNAPYGNNDNKDVKRDVPAQWFPGTDPSFKKEVFDNLKFDENFFGWSLGEDIDIAYRIFKKYGWLYVVPASIEHENPAREDTVERLIKRVYMNQINHFYMFYKLMPEKKIRFTWNIVGLILLRSFSLFDVLNLKKRSLEFRHFIKSLSYCLRNKEKIKKGDLSIPYS